MNTFTDKQIAQLRKAFSGHAGQPLDPDQLAELNAILEMCQQEALVQLANLEPCIQHVSLAAMRKAYPGCCKEPSPWYGNVFPS